MNETTQTYQTEAILGNEERMYLLVGGYLCRVMDVVPDFQNKHFLALRDALFDKGKVEAIKYLRNLFPSNERSWITTGYDNNKFERFINTDFPHFKPQQSTYSKLCLKDAKDIVNWIEANRKYTQY